MTQISDDTGIRQSIEPTVGHILIVDDHPLFSNGLGDLLLREGLAGHIDHARNLNEAQQQLSAAPGIDLILLDLRLPREGGLALMPFLASAGLPTPVIVISSAEDEGTVRAVQAAGVQGFLPKSAGRRQLVRVIRAVARGETAFPAGLPPAASPSGLTPRQQQVLTLLAEGLPNKRICQVLDLTEHTVKTHVKAVFQQLDVHNRTECVALARSLGLISDRLGVLDADQRSP